jgi:excisionase family DNA binding protein
MTKEVFVLEQEEVRINLLKMLLEWEEKLISDQKNKKYVYERFREDQSSGQVLSENVKIPSVLSVKELSDYLRVSTDSIYTMVRENQIPFLRVRRRILFHKHAVDSWILGNSKAPQ